MYSPRSGPSDGLTRAADPLPLGGSGWSPGANRDLPALDRLDFLRRGTPRAARTRGQPRGQQRESPWPPQRRRRGRGPQARAPRRPDRSVTPRLYFDEDSFDQALIRALKAQGLDRPGSAANATSGSSTAPTPAGGSTPPSKDRSHATPPPPTPTPRGSDAHGHSPTRSPHGSLLLRASLATQPATGKMRFTARSRFRPRSYWEQQRMPRMKAEAIDQADLGEYLNTESGFAFELHCLETLNGLGFACEHGGSYTDPVTKKTRQFDLRAHKAHQHLRVRCAIECKHLHSWFPLLVVCVPRPISESFHHLICSYPDRRKPTDVYISGFQDRCVTLHIQSPHSIYSTHDPVGKSCAQVGRKDEKDGPLHWNDSEVFERWSQALAAASDLADWATEEGDRVQSLVLSLILPILVVPNQTLWQVNYGSEGKMVGDPFQTDRCSFYVGKSYTAGKPIAGGTDVTVSHLEFVTLSGLEELLRDIAAVDNAWFPHEPISRLLASKRIA